MLQRLKPLVIVLVAASGVVAADAPTVVRPNILWITSEDNGCYLGCYDDPVARTPNIDRLAGQGVRYLHCCSNAAVCAPARQTIISGMYASSIGGQHMRSVVEFPKGVPYFPKLLRQAGYYTTNNSKTDYNGGPLNSKQALKDAWDQSSGKAHWRNRPDGKPFFAVFNIGDSHESRLFPARWKNREVKTNPAAVQPPAYLPDVPKIRLDMARYYDCVESMDSRVEAVLEQLESDGLQDDTIVFYFSDHGGAMPRGKSFLYESGTHVPLIIRFPDKWRHLAPAGQGDAIDRLVSFVDFAPTALSLAGVSIPEYMQGRAFLGEQASVPRQFVHTFRGRRGERYDIVRGVRSRDFLYLRNYTPHLPVMQFNGYSSAIPSYAAWYNAWIDGKCSPQQSAWFEPKASEELYRLADDPDNIRNLADDPKYRDILKAMRAENERHLRSVRDSVFFPEGMSGRTFDAYQDNARYPLDRLIALANAVSAHQPSDLPQFSSAMTDANPCIRYWGVTGCVTSGKAASGEERQLARLLEDPQPVVQVQAARALAGLGETKLALPVLHRYLEQDQAPTVLQAVLAVDECHLLAIDPSLRDVLNKVKNPYATRVTARLLAEG